MDDTPARFAARLISADVGTWDYDPNTDRLHADPAFARLLGLDAASARGGPLANVLVGIHPADRERMADAFDEVLRSGYPFAAQFRVCDADGRVRSVVGRARIEFDDDGRVRRMPGILIDVSEWAMLERRLRDSEARTRLALDAAGMGVWNVSATRELHGDRRFAELFSGSPEPLDFDRAVTIVHPDDRGRVLDAIGRAMRAAAPEPYDEVYRVRHPGSGRERWVQAIGHTRIEDGPDGARLVSFDGVLFDVTDRRRMEQELRQLANNLADADRRKDKFLAMLAHELRNPLAPISNAVSLLADTVPRDATEPGDQRLLDAIGTIERQTAHLTRLVDDLMDVGRISHGRVTLERSVVALRTIVRDALETVRPAIEVHRCRLSLAMPDRDILVSADATRLSQALINLLDNAIKYSPPGSAIAVSVARRDDIATISIRDEGVGLDAAQTERIFNMFVQVDDSVSRSQDGLGIGLALVQRFVTLHGGRVWVESAGRGAGCTFHMAVPTLPAGVNASRSPSATFPVPPPVTPRTARPPLADADHAREGAPTRRVLIVDDNEDGANTWVAVLAVRGLNARAAHDGIAALRLFREFAPQVVLLDIGMPGMDGYETCRRLRRLPGGDVVHVIAVTGWGSDDDRERTRHAGFDQHLVKPVKASQMLTLLAALPATRRARGAATTIA